MTSWTPAQVQDFWLHDSSPCKGDSTAGEVVRLVGAHVHGSVLDIGAASGSLRRVLPAPWDYVGIDIAPRSVEVRYGDVRTLDFPSESFGTVFALDVLEHLDDETLDRGLAEIWRVLVPRGTFIVGCPNTERMRDNEVYCPGCRTAFHRYGHMRTFTPETILSTLERAAFHCVKTITTNLWLRQRPLGRLRIARHRWRGEVLPDLLAVGRRKS